MQLHPVSWENSRVKDEYPPKINVENKREAMINLNPQTATSALHEKTNKNHFNTSFSEKRSRSSTHDL
jgi:hypothetical protein